MKECHGYNVRLVNPLPQKLSAATNMPILELANSEYSNRAVCVKIIGFCPIALLVKITDSSAYYLDIYFSLPAHFKFTH